MSKLGLGKTRLHTYLLELETNRLIRTNQIATDNGPRRHIYLDFEGLRKRYKKAMKG
jgi:predicted transcriptional regulator